MVGMERLVRGCLLKVLDSPLVAESLEDRGPRSLRPETDGVGDVETAPADGVLDIDD